MANVADASLTIGTASERSSNTIDVSLESAAQLVDIALKAESSVDTAPEATPSVTASSVLGDRTHINKVSPADEDDDAAQVINITLTDDAAHVSGDISPEADNTRVIIISPQDASRVVKSQATTMTTKKPGCSERRVRVIVVNSGSTNIQSQFESEIRPPKQSAVSGDDVIDVDASDDDGADATRSGGTAAQAIMPSAPAVAAVTCSPSAPGVPPSGGGAGKKLSMSSATLRSLLSPTAAAAVT